MAKLVEKIGDSFGGLIEPKEKLLAVGQLSSGLSPFIGLMTLGILTLFTTKYWYIAVTDKRALFIKLTIMSKPDFNQVYSVSVKDIRLSGSNLTLQQSNEALPDKFRLWLGNKRVTGLDRDQLAQALTI